MSKKAKKAKIEKKVVPDDYDDIFGEKEELPIIKKKPKAQQIQTQNVQDIEKQTDQENVIRCPIETINIQQVSQSLKQFLQILQDILYESSKESNFSRNLKSILSNGQRDLKDKLKHYHFKWQSLGHANIGRQEYQRQEQLLREQQAREINEIHSQVIAQLGAKGVQGFQSKEEILNEFRSNFMKKRHLTPDGPTIEEFQFYVDQEEANQLKRDQVSLLEKLLKEQHLIKDVPELKRFSSFQEQGQFKSNQMQRTQSVQNSEEPKLQLLSKLNIPKLIKESMGKSKVEELLKLDGADVRIIPRNVRVMLLDSKSDELYTDKDFQQDQVDKYIEVFNRLKNQSVNDLDLEKMLELTIYIVNNNHYQQKFSLQDDNRQITAKDLLNYIEKLQKQQ